MSKELREYKTLLRYYKLQYKLTDLRGFPLDEMLPICRNSNWKLTTANGLTSAIVDYITYRGGYANRINTVGIYNAKLGRRVKSSTKKGTPDIDAILNGVPLKIEVKIGRDKMSDDQAKQMADIKRAGGNYFIAKDFPSVYEWLNSTCSIEPIDISIAKRALSK